MRRIKYIVITFLIILLSVIGLWWLAVILLALSLIIFSYNRYAGWLKENKFLDSTIKFICVILLAIFIKVFVFEVYSIPSGSMEDTLLIDDKIVVNKLIYGPVVPRSPSDIPWINALFFRREKTEVEANFSRWKYKRLNGISKVERGDVMVFTFSRNSKKCFIKRCCSLPGDTLQIIDSKIYNNGEMLPETSLIKHNHRPVKPDTLNDIFPWDKNYTWTINNFGPLIIPYVGMTIQLTKENYILYQDMFDYFEDFKPVMKEDKFYIADKEVTEYTFRKNYFFMMGDNRNNSTDSRHRGVIPKEQIIAKAVNIVYPGGDKVSKWKKIFKSVK
jgi:signal peptidase I